MSGIILGTALSSASQWRRRAQHMMEEIEQEKQAQSELIRQQEKRDIDIAKIASIWDEHIIKCQYGIPTTEFGIILYINNNPKLDINMVYDNGITLLDRTIDISSLYAFNKILNIPSLSIDILMHSINYINEYIAKLPKNKTRKNMKIILESKLRSKGFDI